MRVVPRPVVSARTAFETCLLSITDQEFSARLRSIVHLIESADAQYLLQSERRSWFSIQSTLDVGGTVTLDEMTTKIYTRTFSRQRSPARTIYDTLRAASGICPLCGQRDVGTLDHYLPKSLHPALAVTPINLIPACMPCNKKKSDVHPATAAEQTLHPYFDVIDDTRWLQAEILQTIPISIRFSAVPSPAWVAPLPERVQRHFTFLKLATLYATHAATELGNIKYSLHLRSNSAGAAGVRLHLEEAAESCRQNQRNSWQTALYEALSVSAWFHEGGFRNIA